MKYKREENLWKAAGAFVILSVSTVTSFALAPFLNNDSAQVSLFFIFMSSTLGYLSNKLLLPEVSTNSHIKKKIITEITSSPDCSEKTEEFADFLSESTFLGVVDFYVDTIEEAKNETTLFAFVNEDHNNAVTVIKRAPVDEQFVITHSLTADELYTLYHTNQDNFKRLEDLNNINFVTKSNEDLSTFSLSLEKKERNYWW